MDNNMIIWKTLEDLLVELQKKTVQIPVNILENLRAARSLIEISYSEYATKEIMTKTEAYITNVKAYLINQAQKVFEPNVVNDWLKRIKEANSRIDKEETDMSKGQFVIGVPRGQQWIRIETDSKLPEEYVLILVKEWHLTVNKQADGRLMIHGQLNDIKAFIKQITARLA